MLTLALMLLLVGCNIANSVLQLRPSRSPRQVSPRRRRLSEVQDVLGHASPEVTKKIYAHYTPRFLQAAVDKYSATPAELVAELEAEDARRRVRRQLVETCASADALAGSWGH